MVGSVNSILIYSTGEIIGDGFWKLPFVRALRVSFPDAKITWLVEGSTVYSSVFSGIVYGLIDEIIENSKVGKKWIELFKKNPLCGRHFDLIIDTQKRLMTGFILKKISHKLFISSAFGSIFSDKKPINSVPKREIERLFMLLSLVSEVQRVTFSPMVVDKKLKELAEKRLPLKGKYIGFSPGAGNSARGKSKCWPLENFIKLAKEQVKKGKIPVFLLGPNEKGMYSFIKNQVSQAIIPLEKGNCLSSPLFTIALSSRLSVSVSNDSGTGHMIAASGSPLISLFGPTNAEKMAPLVSSGTVIKASSCGSDDISVIKFKDVDKEIDKYLKSDM